MRLWLDTIAKHAPAKDIRTIVDVGCGTGRFCEALADEFDAQVIGVDPSPAMLAKARSSTSNPRVQYHDGSAESLPVADDSACLIYMSMAYHHLSDVALAGREFRRVLRDGGLVCIRNSTKELLESVPYLEYFPTARDANHHRIPSQQDVIDTMRSSGFSLVAHEVVEQRFADSPHEYCHKISQRGLSDLVRLSDAEFETGVRSMKEAIARNELSGPILEPVDLFVFSAG